MSSIRNHIRIVEAMTAPSDDVSRAVTVLVQAFKRTGHNIDIYPAELHHGEVQAMVRYWGNWVMPPDADEEDDDYDHKILSDESAAKASAIVAEVSKRFPTVKLYWSQEEKYHITLAGRAI